MTTHLRVLAASLAVALCAAAPAQTPAPAKAPPADKAPESKTLTPGDPAPTLKVEKWLKGAEVKSLEKGKVYVVDFWAHWSSSCKTTVPHLTELAKKHKDKATIIGVAIWEDGKDPLADVQKFLTDIGDQADYSIAYGGKDGEMERTWMRASRTTGIPASFIVDKDGNVAWFGRTLDVDEPLQLVIDGKFDPKAAANEAKKQAELEKKVKDIEQRLRNAKQGGRTKEMLDATLELVKLQPKKYITFPGLAFKTALVDQKDADAAYAFAKVFVEGVGTEQKMWMDINAIAWTILDDPGVKKRDFELAMKYALKAADMTAEKDGAVLDTLARAYWETGEKTKAVEVQERAVELVKKDNQLPEATKKELQATLDRYKRATGK